MKLDDISNSLSALRFPRLGQDAHPDRDAVSRFRSEIRNAIADDEFIVDCIAHDLEFIESGAPRIGLTPCFVAGEFGVSVAFSYWSPGGTPGPHEHTAWSVSAVCYNRLSVVTYDRRESYRRKVLVPKNVFEADAGEVGYLCEPAIHCPHNPSNDWSVTLHISSPRDGEPVDDDEPLAAIRRSRAWVDLVRAGHPYACVARARERRREADLLIRMLLASRDPRVGEMLGRCERLASSAMQASLRAAMPDRFAARSLPRLLKRVHSDVRVTLERDAPEWAVLVETPAGPTAVLRINDVAYDAFAFASTSASFEVSALPGSLTDEERDAIADTLEDIGLFTRVET